MSHVTLVHSVLCDKLRLSYYRVHLYIMHSFNPFIFGLQYSFTAENNALLTAKKFLLLSANSYENKQKPNMLTMHG